MGGDEFFAVLDISDPKTLVQTVNRIRKSVEAFNKRSKAPYKISFSMGYSIYNTDSKMDPAELYRFLDSLMYKEKKSKSYNN